MKKNRLFKALLFCIGCILISVPASYGEDIFPASIKVEGTSTILKEIAETFPLDLFSENAIQLFVTEAEYEALTAEYQDLIKNGEITISIIQTAAEANANFQTKTIRSDRGYHTYDTMLSELKTLANQNSSFVKLHDIGDAEGGQHDIWALKISDNAGTEEDEPGVYLTGAHHGNERPTVEMVMYVINHIIQSYGKIKEVTDLVNNTEIWMIPMVNPYGHTQNSRTNANGVDLNRNYPATWGNSLAPLSEGETKAIVNGFLANFYLVAGIDYHTYGGYYMSPWAHTATKPSDHKALKALCDKMAGTVGYRSVTINEFLGGTVAGSSVDYYYGQFAIFGYGVELGDSHSPPVSQMEQIVSKNLDAAMMMLARPLNATVTGRTTLKNKAVQATVQVEGIDTSSILRLPYKSNAAYGRYHRILEPGTYTLLFSFNGKTIKKSNVVVKSVGQTVVDVDFDSANPDPNPPPPPDENSCVGNCGGKAPGGCYCDNYCEQYNDCCKDKVSVCGK